LFVKIGHAGHATVAAVCQIRPSSLYFDPRPKPGPLDVDAGRDHRPGLWLSEASIIYLLLPGMEQQFIPNLAAAANGGIVLEAEELTPQLQPILVQVRSIPPVMFFTCNVMRTSGEISSYSIFAATI
jgi:hypothetical protein